MTRRIGMPGGSFFLLLLLALPFAHAGAEDRQHKQDAVHAAQIDAAKKSAGEWLALVDAANYAESWRAAAPFLKEHFTEAAWDKRLSAMRKPIDPAVDRTLSTSEYRDQFPGLPPGQYVALVWESYFGARHQVLESLIMAFDGTTWKMIGYAVQ